MFHVSNTIPILGISLFIRITINLMIEKIAFTDFFGVLFKKNATN